MVCFFGILVELSCFYWYVTMCLQYLFKFVPFLLFASFLALFASPWNLCCYFSWRFCVASLKRRKFFVKVKSCLFMESSLECVLCELLLAFKKEGKTRGLFSSYHYYFLLNICFLACFGHAYTS